MKLTVADFFFSLQDLANSGLALHKIEIDCITELSETKITMKDPTIDFKINKDSVKLIFRED